VRARYLQPGWTWDQPADGEPVDRARQGRTGGAADCAGRCCKHAPGTVPVQTYTTRFGTDLLTDVHVPVKGWRDNMDVVIRAASPDDAPAIAGVHVTSLRASSTDLLPAHLVPLVLAPPGAAPRASAWRRWIERARTSTFVSLVGGSVTGFCTLHPSPHSGGADAGRRTDARDGDADRADPGDSGGGAGACGEIASFYVLPAEWRQGTGRRLGETAVAEAHARGFAEVAIWVLETNARARGFYEALGFRPDGESKVFLERPYATWRELRYRRAV